MNNRHAPGEPLATEPDGTAPRRPELLHSGPTPPAAPLAMPTQSLETAPVVAFDPADARTALARLIAFGGAAALTGFGAHQMLLVFGDETQTALQSVLLALFTVTFGWIGLSATQSLAGLMCAPRPPRVPRDRPLTGRTALLMPVYNEDPAATCGALAAMGEALAREGQGAAFEIFILSDTRDPAVWLAETAAVAALRERLAGRIAVWYRRRRLNTGKKAGNLRDFLEGWGARYDYMLVLDADSLMDAGTMIEMARRMDAAPRLGILQTVPVLAGGTTLFARLQQFAGRMYGPIVARGVAAWQGLDGNYWGHNALIRTRAFAGNCGLPELPGRKPFGGHVLSHDFVEAALIRRGGWEVRMDPDLEGSWEGAPPSLVDLATRDRRWAQGNLQHIKVVGARGLRVPNRIHFLIGIGAYLMSPIWLAMLLVGMVLTAQSMLVQPQYFPDALQLFPNWPVFDAERMRWLFALSMGLLLLPKALGLGRVLVSARRRRQAGGGLRLAGSTVLELVLSALYAPILMLLQARQVADILLGRDSGWSTQRRDGAEMPWAEALRRHWGHVAAGVLPGIAFAWFAPDQLVWISPVLAGLILSPALSRLSGSARLGRALLRLGLLATPEELAPPPVAGAARAAAAALAPATAVTLARLAQDPAALATHLRSLGPVPDWTEAEALHRITVRAKIEAAPTPEQAVRWLTAPEREVLTGSADLLRLWASLSTPGAGAAREAVQI
ncbi:MAG: glucans biosynthesis glucosyltransferase MdoH [Thermohalobaculum sp.]|nr:glucans biosynthesis glucosyltransferase MdoH [Thermohalobaculum sp.]